MLIKLQFGCKYYAKEWSSKKSIKIKLRLKIKMNFNSCLARKLTNNLKLKNNQLFSKFDFVRF